ncbi:MAG: hypothetical protein G01um101420_266 [Parcubacteria group bacterium Gr01-1014_20]|nr:MAG: hypothetical protein G01um101420_266 [Parcubacteria group bacterium Gr01-1014_20]
MEKNKGILGRKILFIFLVLCVAWVVIGTWIVPRTLEHDKLFPPDGVIIALAILMIPLFYVLLVLAPRVTRVSDAYARKDERGLAVGFFTCPTCHKRFCGPGACLDCPNLPDLVYREEVWQENTKTQP